MLYSSLPDVAIFHTDCTDINFWNLRNVNTTKLAESIINIAKIYRDNHTPEINMSEQ